MSADEWAHHRPKLPLYEILDKPGGITVEQALQRAEQAIESHRGRANQELREAVERLEALARASGEAAPDAIYADAMFVVDIAGVFAPPLCRAGQSLCELVHRLRAAGRWDWPAVTVHVASMRLLIEMRPANMEASIEAVLHGLNAVVAKYPDPCRLEPAAVSAVTN